MYPQSHFLFALLIAEILVAFNLLNHQFAFLTAVIAVVVDFDHYAMFVLKYKCLRPKEFWNSHVLEKNKIERTSIHHFPGFSIALLISVILFFVNLTAFFVFVTAYFSHLFLDYLPRTKRKRLELKPFGFMMKISIYEIIFDFVLIAAILLLSFFI